MHRAMHIHPSFCPTWCKQVHTSKKMTVKKSMNQNDKINKAGGQGWNGDCFYWLMAATYSKKQAFSFLA